MVKIQDIYERTQLYLIELCYCLVLLGNIQAIIGITSNGNSKDNWNILLFWVSNEWNVIQRHQTVISFLLILQMIQSVFVLRGVDFCWGLVGLRLASQVLSEHVYNSVLSVEFNPVVINLFLTIQSNFLTPLDPSV